MRRLPVLCLLVMLLVMSCGCIDVFKARDALAVEEESPPDFKKVNKLDEEDGEGIYYEFTTTNALRSTREKDTVNMFVKEQTKWLQVEIDAQFEVVPIPDQLKEFVEDRPRWLDVTIFTPRGERIFKAHYNTTTYDVVLNFNNPHPGLWQLEYEARGIGSEFLIIEGKEYHDNFAIRARALEPT